MHHDGVQDRRRVGEAGGLDHDPAEGDAAIVEIAQELLERGHELAADRAAQAAARQQDHVVGDLLDQQMVEPDVAELVDQNGGAGERGVGQQPVEQRGLAGAEEAGKHGQRDRRGRQTPRARRRHFGGRCDQGFGLAAGLAAPLAGGFFAATAAAGLRLAAEAFGSGAMMAVLLAAMGFGRAAALGLLVAGSATFGAGAGCSGLATAMGFGRAAALGLLAAGSATFGAGAGFSGLATAMTALLRAPRLSRARAGASIAATETPLGGIAATLIGGIEGVSAPSKDPLPLAVRKFGSIMA